MDELGSVEDSNQQHNFQLKATIIQLGNDILIIISGMHDHIGSITLAQPYTADLYPNILAGYFAKSKFDRISASISTLTQYHHRDDQLLAEFARKLAQNLTKIVSVIGGIHIDNISKEEIEIVAKMLTEMQEEIIQKLH